MIQKISATSPPATDGNTGGKMKKALTILTVLMAIALLSTNAAFAQDNGSIPISCIIPAIPGINEPFIEEETVKTKENIYAQSKVDSQEEILPQSPAMMQQEDEEEQLSNKGQDNLLIVRTIYSR